MRQWPGGEKRKRGVRKGIKRKMWVGYDINTAKDELSIALEERGMG